MTSPLQDQTVMHRANMFVDDNQSITPVLQHDTPEDIGRKIASNAATWEKTGMDDRWQA